MATRCRRLIEYGWIGGGFWVAMAIWTVVAGWKQMYIPALPLPVKFTLLAAYAEAAGDSDLFHF